MPITSIVIPCFNESERLNRAAFLAFVEHRQDIELRFVNDGSSDDTIPLLREMERENPERIRVCDLPENQGKAEAVRQGMLEAVEEGFRFVGFWDADLATPLESIPVFYDVLRRRRHIDVVVGTRMKLLGHNVERKRLRSLCGRLFATASVGVLNTRVYDTQCGAKLFRVNRRMQKWLSQPFQSRWIFDVELLARMQVLLDQEKLAAKSEQPAGSNYVQDKDFQLRQRVFELPLDGWHDVAGSKLKGRDFVKAASELARLFWQYRIGKGANFLRHIEEVPAMQTWRDWSEIPVAGEQEFDHRKAA